MIYAQFSKFEEIVKNSDGIRISKAVPCENASPPRLDMMIATGAKSVFELFADVIRQVKIAVHRVFVVEVAVQIKVVANQLGILFDEYR
jgi:hypothetical protein